MARAHKAFEAISLVLNPAVKQSSDQNMLRSIQLQRHDRAWHESADSSGDGRGGGRMGKGGGE